MKNKKNLAGKGFGVFDYLAENLVSTIEMGFGVDRSDFGKQDFRTNYDEQRRRNLNVGYIGGVMAGAGLSVYCGVDTLTELYSLAMHASSESEQWRHVGNIYMNSLLGMPFGHSLFSKCFQRGRDLNK